MKNKQKPDVRFPSFNDDWQEYKADSIFYSVSDKNYPELPVLSASQEKGMVFRKDIGIDIQYDKDSTKTYKRVTPGQFVIHLRSFQGGFAFSDIEGITSPAYTVLDFKNKDIHDSLFWKSILTSRNFIKRLETVTYGIRDGRSISFNDFSTLKFKVPNYSEQLEISSFFKTIDNLLFYRQQELDTLKQTKQGFLQKMFPKEGESVPELRFSGFTNDWEKSKIGEITDSFSGGTPSASNKIYYGGAIPFIRSGEINSESTELFLTEEGLKNSSAKLVNKGDVLYAMYGATSGEVGISKINGAINQAILALKPKGDNDANFITQWLIRQKTSIVNTFLQGGQGNLSGTIVKEIFIPIPKSKEEQIQIGNFFEQLDQVIALQQQELDALKQTKKAFLQKMFV